MENSFSNKKLLVYSVILLVLVVIISSSIIAVTGRAGTTAPQCSDKKDNDGDKKCDYAGCTIRKVFYPADPDCTDAQDNTEACQASAETCDGKDNDCDGSVDENLVQQCGVSDTGECQFGTKTCSAGVWGACTGNIDPIAEICDTKDNDCNGLADEGCNCINGATQACGTDVGECTAGTQTCVSGDWAACLGEVLPATEICDTKDNDCDGSADEGCNCVDGQTKACGTDVGECTAGTQTCVSGDWAACVGSVGPSTEVCDTKDNDCDGSTDEGVCFTDTCYDSDGWTFTTLGNVSGLSQGASYTKIDYCTNSQTVMEYYCSGTSARNYTMSCLYVQCGTGNCTTCSAGACK